MNVPSRWQPYHCDDYFASPLAKHGWWDPGGQYWYIEPAARVREDRTLGFLVIGGPGVDGMAWGYRRGQQGLWLHDPIDGEFRFLADSAEELRAGYASGRITV